ncbi:MAG: NADH-quinone oxidoreductase subunit A [Myxococcales bacterium]|nr:NADH-quinone oxidoreductase subunit A [Myxococcales bacterium]
MSNPADLVDVTALIVAAGVVALISVALGAVPSLLAGRFAAAVGRPAPAAQGEAFEGGSEPAGEAHAPLALHLHPLMLTFLVFDLAIVALYPFALLLGQGHTPEAAAEAGAPQGLVGAGAVFGCVMLVAWLHVRRSRAATWGA